MTSSDFAMIIGIVLVLCALIILLIAAVCRKNPEAMRAFADKYSVQSDRLAQKLRREIAFVQFLGYRDAWRSGIGGGIIGALVGGEPGAIIGGLLSGGRKRSRMVFQVRYVSGDTCIRDVRANSRECRELLDFISKHKTA